MITATGRSNGAGLLAVSSGGPSYVVTFVGEVSSDNAVTVLTYTGAAQIPLGTSAKKADRLIREAMAAEILLEHNLTIDPDDIYIAFS